MRATDPLRIHTREELQGLLKEAARPSKEAVPIQSGVDSLDRLLQGGFPRAGLVEITGGASSGRTGLIVSLLARATARKEAVAYIDTFDSLAPDGLQKAGVNLRYLLWARCRHRPAAEPVQSALKAADIVARAGIFGVVVLDLAPLHPEEAREVSAGIPFSAWQRLKGAARETGAMLLIASRKPLSGSASSLGLNLRFQKSHWHRQLPTGEDPFHGYRHACLLRGIWSEARLQRGKRQGHVAFYSRLQL